MRRMPITGTPAERLVALERMAAEPRRLLYDAKLKRPGCVLLAAAYGCDTSVCHRFPPGSWLTYPTPDMRVYEGTGEEIGRLVEITEKAMKKEAKS
jgi:hypothetical protein